MQNLISALAAFAFAGALFAQEPLAGTWKLDSAKTKYTAGTPPKDETLAIEELGHNLRISVTRTYADRSPLSIKFTIPKNGGPGHVQEGPYDAVTSKRGGTNEIEITYMKNGEEIASYRAVVSRDGKTIRTAVRGENAQREAVEGTDVFEKQ